MIRFRVSYVNAFFLTFLSARLSWWAEVWVEQTFLFFLDERLTFDTLFNTSLDGSCFVCHFPFLETSNCYRLSMLLWKTCATPARRLNIKIYSGGWQKIFSHKFVMYCRFPFPSDITINCACSKLSSSFFLKVIMRVNIGINKTFRPPNWRQLTWKICLIWRSFGPVDFFLLFSSSLRSSSTTAKKFEKFLQQDKHQQQAICQSSPPLQFTHTSYYHKE